jgi:alpha-galactosidase
VLDDGWFGKREDDTSSLGDWYPNMEKLPGGISGLARKIEAMGMKFGLWFEPEMISRKSRLYEEHPDWMLGSKDRPICAGRHQYVLDFSREEVVDYIGDRMAEILKDGSVSYVKWDMNRSITDLYSAGGDREYQGMVYHRQILGVYRLYERLTTEFPKVLFESCASGGARFDPGILYYAPQGWASDDTDAVERIRIQYGTSYVYPISSIGSHVSAIPNHQTFRKVPLETRAAVAYFGTFGYELDLNLLTEEEQRQVAEQVRFMKQHRRLLQQGTFYRLQSPFESNESAWIVVSEDRTQAIAAYFRILQPVNTGYRRLKLAGLDPDMQYRISDRSYTCRGDELMHAGLVLSDYASGVRTSQVPQGDYQARIFLLEKE